MKVELEITEDGSHTLAVPELKEHYHSIHGAVSESKHIFIEAGLKYSSPEKEKLNVLEIGFGTGLNALLTCLELSGKKTYCDYVAIEKFPVQENIYQRLNYPDILGISKELFLLLHQCDWGKRIKISPEFFLKKICCDAAEMQLPENFFDLVYFDAFGPDKQAEVWSENIFTAIYISMKDHAVLTTYSTKGVVKRMLKNIGFNIEKLPGPKGKREILRAVKDGY
jgi:tRNA U34 5-methylaminomethyl-2-thiouridine-forming methyltransferase MnmC